MDSECEGARDNDEVEGSGGNVHSTSQSAALEALGGQRPWCPATAVGLTGGNPAPRAPSTELRGRTFSCLSVSVNSHMKFSVSSHASLPF